MILAYYILCFFIYIPYQKLIDNYINCAKLINNKENAMIKTNSITSKIAYTAMFVAICFIINYLYIPFGSLFSVSFVPAVCFLAGITLNPILAIIVGGLADLLGCFAHGYAPNLFILLSTSLWGFFMGISYKYIKTKTIIRIIIGGVVGFVICSFFLNSYGLYTYTSKGTPFILYALTRAPIQLVNLAVNIFLVMLLDKALKSTIVIK